MCFCFVYVFVLVVLMLIGLVVVVGQVVLVVVGIEWLVVIEGVVFDQVIKVCLLKNLCEVYGVEWVVDCVQVEFIVILLNWGDYVVGMINFGLKWVLLGKLEINGQLVWVSGEVGNEVLCQQVVSDLSLVSNIFYMVINVFKVGFQQKLLDQILVNCIIEFQSGSVKLILLGMCIFDEMFEKMVQMGDISFVVIGYIDNVG